jgi:hypothetical protein
MSGSVVDWTVLSHPPYSPDFVSSDFYLLYPMKNAIRRRKYRADEVIDEVKMWLLQTPEE